MASPSSRASVGGAGAEGLYMPGNTEMFFEELSQSKVRDHSGKDMMLGSLWQNDRVLIRLFRRLGCAYCRGEAKILHKISEKMKEMNVRMVGCGTDFGADEFVDLGFWGCEDFYTTPNYDVHKHVQGVKHVFGKGLGTLFKIFKTSRARPRLFNELGGKDEWDKIPQNLKGSDEYYGCVLLVGPGNRLHYSYMQQYPGDFPSNDDLISAMESAEKRQPILTPPPQVAAVTKADAGESDPDTTVKKKKKPSSRAASKKKLASNA